MVKYNSRFMFKRYYLIQEMYFSIRNIYWNKNVNIKYSADEAFQE